jgi:hypothetical protein
MFSDPDFAVRSQVVDKRGRLLGEDGRTRKADEAIKRWVGRVWQYLSQTTDQLAMQQLGGVPAEYQLVTTCQQGS